MQFLPMNDLKPNLRQEHQPSFPSIKMGQRRSPVCNLCDWEARQASKIWQSENLWYHVVRFLSSSKVVPELMLGGGGGYLLVAGGNDTQLLLDWTAIL